MATIEELNVVISANVKGLDKGIKKANRRLKSLGKTGKKGNKELNAGLKNLGARFTNLASSVAIVQGPLGGVAGRFSALAAVLKRVNIFTLATIGIFTALTVVVGKSLTKFIPFEKVTLRLGSVLKATGREAETSVKRLDKFAVQLGKATLTSRLAVLEAAAALATFQNIRTDQFERIIEKAQDLAAVFGGDLKSNTVLLARALSAPGEAFTILERRVGKFTLAERELLKELQDTGRIAQAQEIIFKKLESTTGAAAREAEGAAGSIDTLGESITNLAIDFVEVTGTAKVFTAAVNFLSAAFSKLNEKIKSPQNRIALLNKRILRLQTDIKTLSRLPQFLSGKAIARSSRLLKEARAELQKLKESLIEPSEDPEALAKPVIQLTEASRKASQEISKNLAAAILESRNNLQAFGNFAENILNRIAARILEVAVTKPLVEGILGALNIPSVPGIGDVPGKALGGPVQANRPVVVGEKGPELLVPTSSGNIIPNNKLGGGGMTVIQNFTIATGADINTIDQKILDATPGIANQAQVGLIDAMQSGGRVSQLVGRKF